MITLFGLGVYAFGMSGFAEIFGDDRIFRFVVLAIVTSFLAMLILVIGAPPRASLVILALAYLFEVLANYYLYRASGVPAIILGYGLMLLGLPPLLVVYVGLLLIVAGRIMVIYGYYSIPERYRTMRRAREMGGG